jgi:hypothetical protein
LKLPVAPNNGDRDFSELFNVRRQKAWSILGLYLQLKLFRKSRDVTIAVSYIISALMSCNFIIKNYVSCKITSYIYLLIFAKSLWLHVNHFIALTKRESVRRFFFVITDQDYPCQHIDQRPRKTRESMTTLTTKKKKACVRIKRVKTESYLTYVYTANHVKHEIIRRYPLSQYK